MTIHQQSVGGRTLAYVGENLAEARRLLAVVKGEGEQIVEDAEAAAELAREQVELVPALLDSRPIAAVREIRDPDLAYATMFTGQGGGVRIVLPSNLVDRLNRIDSYVETAPAVTIAEIRDPNLAGATLLAGSGGALRAIVPATPAASTGQAPPTVQDIILPRKIHVLIGGTGAAIEQTSLYFKNLIRGSMSDKLVNCISANGRHYADFWRVEPGNTGNGYANAAAGAFDLTVAVTDVEFQTLKSATTSIIPVSKTAPATPVRLLSVGDSINRDGSFLLQAALKLTAVTLQGIRHYADDDPALNREGRGGWTMETYFTRAGDATGRDSPFLFPVGVSGTDYRGNVEGWKRIINISAYPAQAYDLDGFQKIARGWADTGDFLYDANGYPANPVVGWVVHDPALAAGSRFRTWNGTGWVAMGAQPSGWEFSIAKYLARYAAAFAGGNPTHISILMGANDFQTLTSEQTQLALPAFKARIDQFIASARAAIPGVKVIINLPTLGAGQDAWAVQLASGQTAAQYDHNIQLTARYLLTAYDTSAMEAAGTYVCAFGQFVDPEYGFRTVAEAPNIYATTASVNRPFDWVHPNPIGHKQAGDALAATLQAIR